MPRLSVLMPVRNGAATVAAAVASTLRAMPNDAELIIWDDASSDATSEEIARVADRRVHVRHSDSQVGPGAALRELCAVSDSEYIARMDADDICLPGRFAVQLAHLRRHDTDLVFSSVVRFRTQPFRVMPSAPLRISSSAIPLHLAVMCMVTHPTLTAKRAALDAAGGYRGVLAEDYDLWLRACLAGSRIQRLAIPTIAYRRHSGQLSFSAAYQQHARGEAQFAQTYREFAHGVLGVDCRWVPGRPVVTEAALEDVEAIRRTVQRRADALPTPQRVLVERTLRHLPSAR